MGIEQFNQLGEVRQRPRQAVDFVDNDNIDLPGADMIQQPLQVGTVGGPTGVPAIVIGAAYNPGEFTAPMSPKPVSGNYLLYWKASQALWRVDPKGSRGLDATFAFDWSPPNVNQNYTQLTAGLRFNEPLPLGFHNTMSLGYVRNTLSPQFLSPGVPAWKSEQGIEFNLLMLYGPLLFQPVVQYYFNVGGIRGSAFVAGFRTKVDF